MYFEIFRNRNLIKRGNEALNELSWAYELMTIPQTELVLPADYLEYLSGREEVRIHTNGTFYGIVQGIEIDKSDDTITLNLEHVLSEWKYRQVPTNYSFKGTLGELFSMEYFVPEGWEVRLIDCEDREIDYVFSRQSRYDALNKVMELTPDLYWRVRDGRILEIGTFGDKTVVVSKKAPGPNNVRLITDPSVSRDFGNVMNMAVPYGDRSDSGMSSTTLRDVYENELYTEDFPIIVLDSTPNNERDYSDYVEQDESLGPNNEYEYAVIDVASVAMENDTILEGTVSFNDIAPSIDPEDTEAITDEDRLAAAKELYDATVRRLIASRRTYTLKMDTEPFAEEITAGDRVRLIYDNKILLHGCSDFQKILLTEDEWYYITNIERTFKLDIEVDSITLEKYLSDRGAT